MKETIRLLTMPLLGLLIMAGGFSIYRQEITLRLNGAKTPGTIAGMLISVPRQGHHLIYSIETELRFQLFNGQEIRATYQDAHRISPVDEALPLWPELETALLECATGDATIMQWVLKREIRRTNDPRRIVTIGKTERATGYFHLNEMPKRLVSTGDRLAPSISPDAPPSPKVLTTRAVFDATDPDRLRQNKGDFLLEFTQVLDGQPIEFTNKNFALHGHPYEAIFRPLFRYRLGDEVHAGISQVGRHGGPTLALRLFGPCLVYYYPLVAERALLVAHAGPPEAPILQWFSRFCEGVFAQWGSATLIFLAGLLFLFTGLLFLSLAIQTKHPRRSPSDQTAPLV